jgi:hypothetical protein
VTATAFSILTGVGGPSEPAHYANHDGSSAAGATAGIEGGFVNVPSGLYELWFDRASVKCAPNTGIYGYPETGSRGVGVAVPVLPGYVSAPVGVSCTSAPSQR